jgi:probable HAF family extracellular repeat protein
MGMRRTALRASSVSAIAACLLGFMSTAALAGPYTFSQIDFPGSTNTTAHGLNDKGDIVGYFYVGNVPHGFLFSGGMYTQIDVPSSTQTLAYGINDSGQIVGVFDGAGGQHGFLKTGSSFLDLGLGFAVGINDAGQVVGSNASGQGTLYSGGSFTTYNYPGATFTRGDGINDLGQIVGLTGDAAVGHGFLLSGGVFSAFPVGSDAQGINNAGEVVGAFNGHGFLAIGGTITTFDDPAPGATFNRAVRINDAGQIAGAFNDATGGHGYLATPVPEPESFAMLLAGLGLLATASFRSRGMRRPALYATRLLQRRYFGSPRRFRCVHDAVPTPAPAKRFNEFAR